MEPGQEGWSRISSRGWQACLTLPSCLVHNSLSNSQLGEDGSLVLKGALEDKCLLKRLE